MTNKYIRSIPGLLAAVLIAGCSQDNLTGSNAESRSSSAANISRVSADPCAIVLMPHVQTASAAANEIDRSILRYQQASADTSGSLPRLERLGWALIEKARDTRDTGFYVLAEQAALCMDSHTPDSAEALLLRGHVLHNLHRFREAEVLARRLVEQRGLWFDFALLGDVLVERGALDEAVDAYQAVADQRPGPQAYTRVSQLRWLKGDLDGALKMMALATGSTSPRTAEAAAWTHVRLALMLMQP